MRIAAGVLALFASAAFAQGTYTPASADGPAQTVHLPAKGPGPVVVLLSGSNGPAPYQWLAADVAKLGYYAVVLDGNDILTRQQDGLANLRKAIERAQRAPQAAPGKSFVIGFSLGGGGALAHAAPLEDTVSAIVAYYPAISWAPNPGNLVRRFKVPVLVLAGGQDTFQNCCLIGGMRTMESAAKETGARFELVVYPDGKHSFIMDGPNYRRDYEQDAWKRTVEMLKQHQPLPAAQ